MKQFRVCWRDEGPSAWPHSLTSSALIAGGHAKKFGSAYVALDALGIGETWIDEDGDVWEREK